MRLSEHPAFSHVDPHFVNHIQQVLDTGSCNNGLEAIQKLMAISREIEKNNVTFTPEMQNVLLNYFQQRLPKNQRAQFSSVLRLVQQMKGSNQLPH